MSLSMSIDDKKVYNEVEDKYDYSHQELSPRFRKFNDWEDLYLGYLNNADNPWKSAVFDPESFEKVERMASHLFATRPRGRYLPREGSDTKGVRIADELLKYQWDKTGQQMHRKFMRMGKNIGIFGTAFGVLHWRYERQERKYWDKKEGKMKTKRVCVWDDPYFQDLYIYDCFPDPTAISVEDMQWFIHNDYTTLEELRNTNFEIDGQKKYKNLNLLEEKLNKRRDNSASVDSYRTNADQIYGVSTQEKEDRILVRRYYARDKWVTWCPDYKVLIENRPNPYWHGELPVHVLTDHDYTNQLYGIGEIEPIEKLQRGLNSVLNQRLDNVRLIMQPVVKTNAASKYSHEWMWAPGRKWRMDKLDDVDIFSLPDVTGQTFMQTANYFKDAMRNALGHQDFSSRAGETGDPTAAQVRAETSEQNVRTRAKEFNVDAMIQRLCTQWIELDQQFLTAERIIRVVGKDAIDVFLNNKGMKEKMEVETPTGNIIEANLPATTYYKGEESDKFKLSDDGAFGFLIVEPDDIQGDMDFIVEVGSTVEVDSSQELANTQAAIKMLGELEQKLNADGKKIDFLPLVSKALQNMGMKNVDEIVTTMDNDALVKQQEAQQAAQQGMMGAMGGGNPMGNPMMQGTPMGGPTGPGPNIAQVPQVPMM